MYLSVFPSLKHLLSTEHQKPFCRVLSDPPVNKVRLLQLSLQPTEALLLASYAVNGVIVPRKPSEAGVLLTNRPTMTYNCICSPNLMYCALEKNGNRRDMPAWHQAPSKMANNVLYESYTTPQITDTHARDAAQPFSSHYGIWNAQTPKAVGSFAKEGSRVKAIAPR
jgi:hypothetical protein